MEANKEVEYWEELEKIRERQTQPKRKKKVNAIIKISEISEEIKAFEVTILLRFILILSIVADLLGIIPIIGNFFAIVFAVIFFILYFINGLGRGAIKGTTRRVIRKKTTKWVLRIFFISAEGIPILGILPFFTILALVEITLSQKKVKKLVNKIAEIKNKIN